MAPMQGRLLQLWPLLLGLAAALTIPKEYKMHNLRQPPEMTEQPVEKLVVFPSDDIVLRCEATGTPPPRHLPLPRRFRWTKDGRWFDPRQEAGVTVVEGSGTLYMNNINTGRHQGVYRCYASNDLGTAMGPEIRVISESTPQWPKEKVSPLEVEEGESVILPCNPPASAVPPKIYWLNSRIVHIAQDERVSMGQDGYLYFANVRRSDSHPDYICHAHYLGPRTIIQKEPIELRVRPTNSVKFRQPRLMVPPGESSSHVALRGSSLALECIAEGFPTPTVEWIRLNGRLPAERVALENSQKTLRIREVVEEDDGEYQCLARNTQGTARHTYTVTVEAAPYWAQQPHSRVYGPGENVRLDCSVYGKPKPLVSWRINGVPWGELAPDPTRTLRSGALILSQVQPNDSLVTQCEAMNHHGRLLANAYIYVIQLPARILTPDKQRYAVVENQTASLDCQTFGAPMPSVEWFTGRMEPALQDERAFVHTNGSLRLTRAQRQDTGAYVCLAQNDQTNVTISAWLEVKGATRIELGPQSAVVKKSSNVTFQCLVRFDETLQERGVEWWRDGRPIWESDDSDKYTIEPGWLRISGVDYTDQGVYSCRAHTKLDAVEESAELRVVGRPGPVSELQVSEPQERRVKLTWTPGDDHNSPIEKFVVEAEDGLRDPGSWRDVSTVPGHQPWAQLHLVPYGDFRFRVRAANRFGRGEPSAASAPVRTSPAAPERYPEGVAGEGNETNNMLITWKPLNRSDWNAPDLSYRVQWRRLGEGGGWSEETVSGPPLLVTRTPTFVPYEIKVQAVNPIGKGPEPPTVVGYSGEDVPQVYPENVGVEIFNSTSVLVSWTLPNRDQLRGHLRGFRVFYWRLGSVGERSRRQARAQPPPLVLTVEGEASWARLGGLRPWSWYRLYVVVFNGRSDGPHSEDIDFSTPEGAPSPPSSLLLERVSDTVLALEWTAPQFPNGALTEYLLQYQQVKGRSWAPCTEISFPVSQLTGALARLDPRAGMGIGPARALTRAGQGEPLVQEGSTVPEPVLPTLENISISLVGPDFTVFTWVPSRPRPAAEPGRTSGQANSPTALTGSWTCSPGNFLPGPVRGRSGPRSGWGTSPFGERVETTASLLTTDQHSFATEGWFIGFICAVVLLLLLLLILCFVKRSKGGKYSVKDKEDTQVDSEARPMKDETFGEYRSLESDNEEKPFGSSQPSLNGALPALGSEDSLADYGGSVDVQFNEDGSFIGQYSGHTGKEPAGNNSSGATSPTTAAAALE
ncbi:LOW QUALITY PROTEIN: neural cell adhesion molecule L1 [Gopherus flavomarginatus]|uniref:LOW QUALITY PROTEIN: neural cell adhesion molecule L1 n=1 Tax=Gopherus flavomarginatus TaxID=286002 RepID=UPI0021CBA3BD|nr:LOW QUALITY PROTEIN: neural cell adhesion molecule L1 [Gopherus flavomarginatus]